MTVDKPPYRVPLVEETRAAPRNGLTVASTFSGAGGSCYGYMLAGYEVVWANDIVKASRQSYRANHPGTVLDGRDIRAITADDVIGASGVARGGLDLFDGSPPCQSFSTAGKREKGWGKVGAHGDGTTQVSDDLFFEYARLVKDLQPRAFVAENVSGLVKGKAKGYFKLILRALRGCGYQVKARVLDAQWLGVPQARRRVIFVGVRNDLRVEPAHPEPLPYRYSVRDALPWITAVPARTDSQFRRHEWDVRKPAHTIGAAGEMMRARVEVGGSAQFGSEAWKSIEEPAGTIGASPHTGNGRSPAGTIKETAPDGTASRRKFTIPELRRICSFPDDYILTGSYAEQWARLGNSVPPVMMQHVAAAIRDRVLLPTVAVT